MWLWFEGKFRQNESEKEALKVQESVGLNVGILLVKHTVRENTGKQHIIMPLNVFVGYFFVIIL